MPSFLAKDQAPLEIYKILAGGVYPRPIALVASCGEHSLNLAPFSFFNVFSIDPPILAFAPLRRFRDGSRKDTLRNIEKQGECTIQLVSKSIVEQVNLCASDFSEEVDEFKKSGLTPLASDLVKPPRVKESPMQMECKLHRLIELGDQAGSGTMVLCEVLKFHIQDEGLASDQLDLVGRCGGDAYVHVTSSSQFDLAKPAKADCLGFDALPKEILESNVYKGFHLSRFASQNHLPNREESLQIIESYMNETSVGQNVLDQSLPVLLKESMDESTQKRKEKCEACAVLAIELGKLELALSIAVFAYQKDNA